MLAPNEVIQIVADHYEVTADEIKGESRKSKVNLARKMVCLALKDIPRTDIINLLNKSYCLINYHIHNMQYQVDQYEHIKQSYEYIKSKIHNQMAVKLTLSQLKSLHDILNHSLSKDTKNNGETLISLHIDDINETVRKRIRNGKANINFEAKQQYAFIIWYEQNALKYRNTNPHGYMTLVDIINQLKPEYAKITSGNSARNQLPLSRGGQYE
ncbi:hypothetical protein [Rhodonellum sp.]|uniref:hypothetical protein n=1 Tax=Rhodonellum sp. TaxID=2231180 RepID=UPI002721585B|nr:hypothetical protein [Rhodonellum sp.]MDO9554560.1 hypothetical protein [Rhodonellum sp.]